TITLFTAEGLLPGDENEELDYYLWRDGQLFRLPGKVDPLKATIGISHDGSTVAFATTSELLPQDGDTSPDVYVARVGGGYPQPPLPQECAPNGNGGCQGPVPPVPGVPALLSQGTYPPNPQPCAKGKVRRSGHCVAKRHRHRHKRQGKAHRTRHANANRRA